MNWDLYPDFSAWEFNCKYTGKNEMRPEFMELLQRIRTEYGKPININSGYRDKTHPLEVVKARGGTHTLGIACDISVRGEDAIELLGIAINRGVKRVGVYQNEHKHWLHIDIGNKYGFPPTLWSK